jgi:diguanylate cyclase (GGDEF)-like protein
VDIKNRLLVYFISLAFLALVFYGLNAYDIARRSSLDAVQASLKNTARAGAGMLSSLPISQAPDAARRMQAAVGPAGEQFVAIVDKAGRAQGRDPAALADWPLAEIAMEAGESGHLAHKDERYAWTRMPLSDSSNSLLIVAHADRVMQAGMRELAGRLVVAGIAVMWVAVWVALLISTMVSRRLAVQTAALEHRAGHDGLTDLPNRTLLNERIAKAIRAADQGERRSVSLVMLDLDRFKEINDTLGHPVGDALLKAVGERIRGALWGSDTVARLGGDEYALLLPLADGTHTRQVIDKVLAAIAEPYLIEGMDLEVEATLGISVYPDDSRNAVELISHADVAMYQAKQRGERFLRYDPELDPHSVTRLRLMGDLRHATERNELTLAYQPLIDIRSRRVLGVEAMLRWNHPRYGDVPPDTFIPQVEQTGTIKPLTYWVIEEALRQCAQWRREGLSLVVSVNLSARVVQDAQLPAQVATLLDRYEVRAEQVEFEITETAIMSDPVRAMQVLAELDTMGVRLAIDDFGMGYTSLAQLKRLPVDQVKIDRSFVLNMLRDANDAMIVRSIVDLAHNINRVVVAEGVESKKLLDALAELKCDVAQGYFFSRPLSAADFREWLRGAEADGRVRFASVRSI